MKEPVQTKYGTCYEEFWLKETLERNGPKDPLNMLPVDPKRDLYRNTALKKLIQVFLKKNPWAFEKTDDQLEDWKKLRFEF